MTTPTYLELLNSIISDLKNKLGVASIAGKSVLNAIAQSIAAKQKIQYITIKSVENNIYPDLCDENNLRRCGRIRLGRDVNPAISGEYIITVSGEIGSVIPVSTTFSNKNSYLFSLDTEYTFTATSGSIQVRALTPGGVSELAISDQLQITQPLSNVNSYATVFSVVTIPIEAESIDEYRVNVIKSYTLLPQGGSRADYRTWTESVSGVREVYPYVKLNAAGEINLYVEAFPVDSSDGFGTPDNTILLAVQNAIEPDKIPMGVFDIHYLPIIKNSVKVEITNISDVLKITEIGVAITDYLYNIRPFIAGADLTTEINKGRMYASIISGIIIDAGVTFDDVVVKVNNVDITTYSFTDGNIPYLESVTNIIV